MPFALVVGDDAVLREATACSHIQADYEVAPVSCGEDALDLITAAEFDGLYCTIKPPGQAGGWEAGTTVSFIWLDRPVVYASAISGPPSPLRQGVFLRKPFAVKMFIRALGPPTGQPRHSRNRKI
jgi:CheY-like chemotaxis protein